MREWQLIGTLALRVVERVASNRSGPATVGGPRPVRRKRPRPDAVASAGILRALPPVADMAGDGRATARP